MDPAHRRQPTTDGDALHRSCSWCRAKKTSSGRSHVPCSCSARQCGPPYGQLSSSWMPQATISLDKTVGLGRRFAPPLAHAARRVRSERVAVGPAPVAICVQGCLQSPHPHTHTRAQTRHTRRPTHTRLIRHSNALSAYELARHPTPLCRICRRGAPHVAFPARGSRVRDIAMVVVGAARHCACSRWRRQQHVVCRCLSQVCMAHCVVFTR